MEIAAITWLLDHARSTPALAGPFAGKVISEIQIWTSVEDNQRKVEAERPDAPRHVQQYLAERRTFVDFWGLEKIRLFPEPKLIPSIASARHPSTKLPSTPEVRFTTSIPDVSQFCKPPFEDEPIKRPILPSTAKSGETFQPRSNPRSRSPHRRDDLYCRRGGERHRSRSYSPKRESRRDDRFVHASVGLHDLYTPRDTRYRSPSPRDYRRREYRSRSPPSEISMSWQRLAEDMEINNMKSGPTKLRRMTFPITEVHRMVQDPAKKYDFGSPKVHINTGTGRAYSPLTFRDPRAIRMLLGKHGQSMLSLAEVNRFFPAVVFQLQEEPYPAQSKSQEKLVKLWLEVKSSSDPLNDGVKWQIDACRHGFEAYQRLDKNGLPCVKEFYYENRRLFHHGKTQQGIILQNMEKPRSHNEVLAQLGKQRLGMPKENRGPEIRPSRDRSPSRRSDDRECVVKRE